MCVLMSDHFLLLDSMEGSSNEQGGDSLTNDWRTQHEPGLRERVIYEM